MARYRRRMRDYGKMYGAPCKKRREEYLDCGNDADECYEEGYAECEEMMDEEMCEAAEVEYPECAEMDDWGKMCENAEMTGCAPAEEMHCPPKQRMRRRRRMYCPAESEMEMHMHGHRHHAECDDRLTILRQLRQNMCGELTAISDYEAHAATACDARLSALYRHIADEERHHVMEQLKELMRLDPRQAKAFLDIFGKCRK